MKVDIDIDGADLNQRLYEKLVEGDLGKAIAESVKHHIQTSLNSWDSPVKRVCERFVEERVQEELESHREEIRDAAAQALTDQVIANAVAAVTGRLSRL